MKNILEEEISYMKKLFETKGGFLIYEQTNDVGYDIATINAELDKSNSDEKKIVNIIKKYTTKASFKNFVDQYKLKSGKDFATDVYRAIQPYNDVTEWKDLKTHLGTLGVTLGNTTTNQGKSSTATLTGLDTPATTTPAAGDRQTNINNIFCSVKGDVITATGSKFSNTKWSNWLKTYPLKPKEIAAAKASCPNSELAKTYKNTSGSGQQNVSQRFSKSLSSAGIQNGKMDVQTLQTIINTLEGGQSNQLTSSQSQPDLAQLTAAINQLG